MSLLYYIILFSDYVKYGAAAAAGVGAVVAAPVVLTAAGFTAAGVAAGSVAAKLMSLAWTYNTGAAVVGGLQAAGAAGMGTIAAAAVGSAGAAVGYASAKAMFEAQKKGTSEIAGKVWESENNGQKCICVDVDEN